MEAQNRGRWIIMFRLFQALWQVSREKAPLQENFNNLTLGPISQSKDLGNDLRFGIPGQDSGQTESNLQGKKILGRM